MNGMRQTTSQITAPANKAEAAGRAPVEHPRAGPGHGKGDEQDRVGEVDRDPLGMEPYKPNSTTEQARSRSAKPHQATAVNAEFWTQANSNSRPSIAST